jgi:hypothetical protein
MPDEALAAERTGFEGASSINQVLQQLIERDQKLMQSI